MVCARILTDFQGNYSIGPRGAVALVIMDIVTWGRSATAASLETLTLKFLVSLEYWHPSRSDIKLVIFPPRLVRIVGDYP